MGQTFAGVLGPLAFFTMLLRGVLEGAGAEDAVIRALLAMAVYAVIGYAVGRTAAWLTDEWVQMEFRRQIESVEGDSAAAESPAATR